MIGRYLVIFGFLFNYGEPCLSQTSHDYEKDWKKIDSLINKKGLTESALKEVGKIYNIAKKEKNEPQLIKSLIYQSGLEESKKEDAIGDNLLLINREIATAKEPAKSILESIEAEMYYNYFRNHRWQLYNRTPTIHFKKENLASWGIQDFHEKISELFSSSIQNEYLLQQTKLESFNEIIIRGNSRRLRPTLFDLLVHRALDYFRQSEGDFIKPADVFQLDDTVAFSNAGIFINHRFVTHDSLSDQFQALKIFQKLLGFHQRDIKPDAFIEADIERIGFAHSVGVMENKEELYKASLERIISNHDGQTAAAKASYLLAEIYASKARQYDPMKDTTNRFAYIQARAICENIVRHKDSSEGKTGCLNLLMEIERKELFIRTEKVNLPNQPFRALVSFRNFTRLYFRLVRMNPKIKQGLNGNKGSDEFWNDLLKLPVLKTFDQTLPDTKDFQKHSAEIKVDSLAVGEYLLQASPSPDFLSENSPEAYQYLTVSSIAYIQKGDDYFVLNRETGKPLQGVNVQLWYQYYDNKQNKKIQRQGESFITGKTGFFRIHPSKARNNNDFRIELTWAGDHLFLDEEYTIYGMEEGDEVSSTKEQFEKNNRKSFFFTDRSIYRPGQTVYFKGITVTKDFANKKYKILPLINARITLLNANGGKTDSLDVTTNEFGSFNGKFLLPENLLNGQFQITDDSADSRQSFSVEEYKRPRFYINYEKLKGNYKINDSIHITGRAKAYSGNSVDGAVVKFRVIRQPRFAFNYMNIRSESINYGRTELSHGTLVTDPEGRFIISFKAIPDPAVNKDLNPLFDYRIISDITDINGETRSAETTVPVSYTALQLILRVPGELQTDSLKIIGIRTQNSAGEFERSLVTVKLFRLQSPERLIRERYWEAQDLFVMNKDEYLRYFPHDEYDHENDYHYWPRTPIAELKDSSNENEIFGIPKLSLVEGWYGIEARARDKSGEELKVISYIQLFDEKNKALPFPVYSWHLQKNSHVEPGEKSSITLGTRANDLFVIQQIEKPDSASFSFFNLNNEKKSFDFISTETDRGGYEVSYSFVKDNRFYFFSDRIDIPWTNKEFKISYETFRNKTLPGEKEKWEIRISGFKKEKIAAELLTSMYDASLDQFQAHSWMKPDLFPAFTAKSLWNGESNFTLIDAQEINQVATPAFAFVNNYDALLSIDFMPKRMAGKALPLVTVADNAMIHADTKMEFSPAIKYSLADTTAFKEFKINPDSKDNTQPIIRKNFNETAFFFPDLRTDTSGNIEFSFTMPEALTTWKWMNMTHSKDLAFGYSEKNVLTQKQLMIQPGAPRFLREGDHMDFSTKIVNLTDSELTGQTELQLIDPVSNQPVDGWFENMQANQYFTVEARQSTTAVFSITVPFQYNKPVLYRIFARAAFSGGMEKGTDFTDGEEALLPVVSNRLLVTESLPLTVTGTGTRNFRFEKLLKSGESPTLNHHRVTVEFTTNPTWYAVEALPYLMEYPHECAEQIFNRFYANALATEITRSYPLLREMFERWRKADTTALQSNLQKNQELKSVLLQETPWVLQAKDETQQKKNIAVLFDSSRIKKELEISLVKLQDMQAVNGSFSWFKGGTEDRYITQYILSGIGHLRKLHALPAPMLERTHAMVVAALAYLDKKIVGDYELILKQSKQAAIPSNPNKLQIQYLYMRSFFPEAALAGTTSVAIDFFRKQGQQHWTGLSRQLQGMIALSLYRTGDRQKAKDILASLKENAIRNEETGMYWKDMNPGYYWDQAPVETSCLLIEAFDEIGADIKSVNDIKTWLLKQKQTQNWKTTKATADGCYALLLSGSNWLQEESQIDLSLGDKLIHVGKDHSESEAGYLKKVYDAPFVNASMGNISVSSSSKKVSPAWGAIYWQYFEDLDRISGAVSPLKVSKKLFVERISGKGPELEPVNENGTLHTGDKVIVRIELQTGRDLEYVHMKDMRSSCMEPVNVLSSYKWQGGLGYYESTQDISTNFFFNWLPRGLYVFEYPLFVTGAGNFGNGVTTAQCMYAPEFSSHSEGLRINVETNR